VLCCLAGQSDAATGSAVRTREVDDRIIGIVSQVAWGAVKDVLDAGLGTMHTVRQTDDMERARTMLRVLSTISLWIDGQERAGIFAWAAAVNRVCGYVLDRNHAGSVEYGYSVHVRGYLVSRLTRIADDSVVLTTTTGWTEVVPITKRITRRIPIHVSIEIRATESGIFGLENRRITHIRGVAMGAADTREFRCGLIRRIAEQRAADELDIGLAEALRTIDERGTGWYLAAGGDDLVTVLRSVIQIGRRMR